MKEFDYNSSILELERIEARVQDPATPLGEIDSLLKTSGELIQQCREYLRGERRKLEE